MAILLLDTQVGTELLLDTEKYVNRLRAVPKGDDIFTSEITLFEILYHGRNQQLLKAANGQQLDIAVRRLQVDRVALQGYPLLPINENVSQRFEDLLNLLKLKKFKNPGRPDLLLASIALAHRATLVTRNTKDFANIPNLKLQNWAE